MNRGNDHDDDDDETEEDEPHRILKTRMRWMDSGGDGGYYTGEVDSATHLPDGRGFMEYDGGTVLSGRWSEGFAEPQGEDDMEDHEAAAIMAVGGAGSASSGDSFVLVRPKPRLHALSTINETSFRNSTVTPESSFSCRSNPFRASSAGGRPPPGGVVGGANDPNAPDRNPPPPRSIDGSARGFTLDKSEVSTGIDESIHEFYATDEGESACGDSFRIRKSAAENESRRRDSFGFGLGGSHRSDSVRSLSRGSARSGSFRSLSRGGSHRSGSIRSLSKSGTDRGGREGSGVVGFDAEFASLVEQAEMQQQKEQLQQQYHQYHQQQQQQHQQQLQQQQEQQHQQQQQNQQQQQQAEGLGARTTSRFANATILGMANTPDPSDRSDLQEETEEEADPPFDHAAHPSCNPAKRKRSLMRRLLSQESNINDTFDQLRGTHIQRGMDNGADITGTEAKELLSDEEVMKRKRRRRCLILVVFVLFCLGAVGFVCWFMLVFLNKEALSAVKNDEVSVGSAVPEDRGRPDGRIVPPWDDDAPCAPLLVRVSTDRLGNETSWELFHSGPVMAMGANGGGQVGDDLNFVERGVGAVQVSEREEVYRKRLRQHSHAALAIGDSRRRNLDMGSSLTLVLRSVPYSYLNRSDPTYIPDVSGRYTSSICLPPGRYRFIVRDAGGNGMCCEHGLGDYGLYIQGGREVYVSSGQFKEEEVTNFEVTEEDVLASIARPSTSPTVAKDGVVEIDTAPPTRSPRDSYGEIDSNQPTSAEMCKLPVYMHDVSGGAAWAQSCCICDLRFVVVRELINNT